MLEVNPMTMTLKDELGAFLIRGLTDEYFLAKIDLKIVRSNVNTILKHELARVDTQIQV
jgi:hypothetical protein